MKNAIFVLMAALLLFAGCASQAQQAPASQAPPSAQTPPPPAENIAVQPPSPAPPAENKTIEPAPPAVVPDTCTVGFQKDASNIYLVMVDTGSQKQLTVRCPSGKMAEKRGTLYFCDKLDIENPAIAYLGAEECGRASFQRGSYEKAGSSKITCRLFLSHPRLTVGESTDIIVQTSTGDKEVTLTYNCGGEMKTQQRSGLVDDGTICKFTAPGTFQIDAKIDGEICDSKLLEVFEKPKDCSLTSEKFDYANVKGEYTYTGKVAARGYSGSDYLKYRCYDIPFEIKLETLGVSTADFVAEFECRSKIGPLPQDPVKVSVGGDTCGQISPP